MKPLPYNMAMGIVDRTAGSNQTCDAANEIGYATLVDSRWYNLNKMNSNRALDKFINSAQDQASASLGETLGEWAQSQEMIVRRCRQLTNMVRAVRSGNPNRVARAFSRRIEKGEVRTLKDKAKSFGDKWLEFHLGWTPLVGDIYGACEALSRDPFRKTSRGNSSDIDNYTTNSAFTNSKSTVKVNYYVGRRIQAKVHVVSPNVALAASLGLVNPLSVAWALVPYSFVVDWFFDVSGFISQLDGLLGCEVEDAFHTTLKKGWGDKNSFNRANVNVPWELLASIQSRGVSCIRTTGLPPREFTFPNVPRFSWQRGATAIALLLKYL